MEDSQIIELYWQRSERAIGETAKKYGDITNRIKDCRNDINHFGMRMNPLTADKLRGNLQKYYNMALEIIGAEE